MLKRETMFLFFLNALYRVTEDFSLNEFKFFLLNPYINKALKRQRTCNYFKRKRLGKLHQILKQTSCHFQLLNQ